MKLVFMFSGQGTQYYQMGRELYDEQIGFKHYMQHYDRMLMDLAGISVVDELYGQDRNKFDDFTDATLTSLAIYIVERAITCTLLDSNIEPHKVVCCSLGTLAGLACAGSVNDEQVLGCILRQTEIFSRRCQSGVMISLLDNKGTVLANTELMELADVAAKNFPGSYVLSLPVNHLDPVKRILEREGIVFQAVPVSKAYHSRWIDEAREEFLNVYRCDYGYNALPVITADLCDEIADTSALSIWNAVRNCMDFCGTLQKLEREDHYHYLDLGASGTLATFAKYTVSDDSASTYSAMMSPFGQCNQRFESLLSSRVPVSVMY